MPFFPSPFPSAKTWPEIVEVPLGIVVRLVSSSAMPSEPADFPTNATADDLDVAVTMNATYVHPGLVGVSPVTFLLSDVMVLPPNRTLAVRTAGELPSTANGVAVYAKRSRYRCPTTVATDWEIVPGANPSRSRYC